jgi:peptidyl-prolyl cis-trans isomerase C
MLTANLSTNFFKTVFLIVGFTSLTSCDYFSRRILTKPVVQIDNLRMTTQDFSKELARRLKDYDALSAKDPKILVAQRDQIINDFVISSVVDLWFAENKLSINRADLDIEIKKVSASYPNDSSFREALNEAGVTFNEWSEKMASSLKKKMLVQKLREGLPAPTENELLSYYNNNKQRYEQKEGVLLSHILVSDENQADIVLKLLKKQKFFDVAKEYSSAFVANVGDAFGWIEKGYLLELDKAFKMPVNTVFGPVKMSDGLHIFKINEKKIYRIKTYAEVKTEVINEVTTLREQAKFSAWLEEQFKRYSIKKNKAVLDSIKVETQ